jgi:hypothetical protein
MRTIPKRIQNSYFQLHKSRLLSKGHLDNDAIKHFEKILNSSLPVNDYEQNIYYFVKDLYYDDPSKFLNYINNSNLQCLILYTNNKNIITHFNLQYKVYINWNTAEKKYIVEIYKSKNSSSNTLSSEKSLSSNSLSSEYQSDDSTITNNSNLILSKGSNQSLNSLSSEEYGIV